MEQKRDILTVRVMKMKKTGISQEEVNNGLKQLITDDQTVLEESKMELYNSVLQEVEDLIGSATHASRRDETHPSQPRPGGKPPNQEPPSWLAPLLSAIGQSQTKVSKKKFLDPDTFDGSQAKYPVFKQQLKAKFDADPEDFPTAKKSIRLHADAYYWIRCKDYAFLYRASQRRWRSLNGEFLELSGL